MGGGRLLRALPAQRRGGVAAAAAAAAHVRSEGAQRASPACTGRAGAPRLAVCAPGSSRHTAGHMVKRNEIEWNARPGLGGIHIATLVYSEDSV